MDVESKIKRSLTSSKSVSNLDKYEKLDGNQRASQVKYRDINFSHTCYQNIYKKLYIYII